MVFNACQGENGNSRDDDERQQNRPQPLPRYITMQPPYDSSGSCDSKQSRECRGLAIRRHKEWQHRHDKDAEAEACSALDETRTDAQQEYGEDNATQILIFLKTFRKFSEISALLVTLQQKVAKMDCIHRSVTPFFIKKSQNPSNMMDKTKFLRIFVFIKDKTT